MKLSLFSGFLTFSALTVSTVEGQAFGVGKKKTGSSFQELNEQAKNAAGGGLGDLDAMMKQMGIDPEEMAKWAEEAGMADIPDLDEVMAMMANMSPEDLAKQMQDAMDLFSGDDMMANMLGNQDEILAMLEETGAVDAEELAKFKADPEYFEQKMKESMDQMKEMLGDPDLLANAAQGMKAAQEMYNNPDALNDMMGNIMKDLSDEDIEEVRQMFIGGGGDPMMKELLGSIDTAELDGILKDPLEWRKAVKEGLGMLGGAGAGGNKIVGEL
mmetsp:Transcript_13354/g.33601  ORF Transcript_13354/g.33601 Transcript_13354/m.33601 type:complete len:271 (+) Transcript_13354:120-932(+)